jgi:hypothetical protein
VSKIYPGSQWTTKVMTIEASGAELKVRQEQSFGEDEDLQTRIEELTVSAHDSRTVEKGAVTVVRWKPQSFLIDHATSDRKLTLMIHYILTGPKTLLRKTTATQIDNGRKFVVLDELEVFQRD